MPITLQPLITRVKKTCLAETLFPFTHLLPHDPRDLSRRTPTPTYTAMTSEFNSQTVQPASAPSAMSDLNSPEKPRSEPSLEDSQPQSWSDVTLIEDITQEPASRHLSAQSLGVYIPQQPIEPSQSTPQPSLPAAILPQASPASWVENLPPKLSQEALLMISRPTIQENSWMRILCRAFAYLA